VPFQASLGAVQCFHSRKLNLGEAFGCKSDTRHQLPLLDFFSSKSLHLPLFLPEQKLVYTNDPEAFTHWAVGQARQLSRPILDANYWRRIMANIFLKRRKYSLATKSDRLRQCL
jgi:hypothetical protein